MSRLEDALMNGRGRRLACLALALAFVCAAPLAAQDVSLRYQWKKGDTLRYRWTAQSNVTMSGIPGLGDMTVTTTLVQVVKMAAEDVAAEGTATLRATFESAKMEMGTPMGSIKYDSAAPSAPTGDPITDALGKAMKALVGASVTLTVTPNGQVPKLQGMEELAAKLKQAIGDEAAMAGFDAIFSNESMMASFAQNFAAVPDKPVNAGDAWKTELKLSNPMAPMISSMTYTLKAIEPTGGAQIARIATTSVIKPAGPGMPNPAMPGMKIQVGTGSGDGEVIFDARLGRLRKAVFNTTIPMTMSMDAPDATAMSMQSTTKSVLTIELID
jgi:Family of unknown function (DUF6263)